MFWADKLVESLDRTQRHIVNDSKTPSGRAHVGALRGVVIHDVVSRVLKERGFDVRYTFGVDDYDPLDELPYGRDEHFRQFLGQPLCEVPPPPGSHANDMADYYIGEFFEVFRYLGVEVETYRMRDVYRSGRFDAAIDAILSQAAVVRDVYQSVSGSVRPADWHPFQVVCEQCGRIGTTEVFAYDGREVAYRCRPDLVTWAQGCGHVGKVSPFQGHGKLPWKLEWVAKWHTMGITVEGAGKDHTTKGGSRDVAAECLARIFGTKPPVNIPYEFFLVEGAKMSSSRGIGVSARDMADFLPPEILRFLMLRSQPNRPINFSPSEPAVTKLFNDFDRCRQHAYQGTDAEASEIFRLSEAAAAATYQVPGFQLLQALVQLPHIDIFGEIHKRNPGADGPADREHLERRIASVRYWLEHFAGDEERLELQPTLPAAAMALSDTQRAYLNVLGVKLQSAAWDEESLQSLAFAAARITPISQQDAFAAIYTALFARERGPRAGALFSYLERDFLVHRFSGIPYAKAGLWRETGVTAAAFEEWLQAERPSECFVHLDFLGTDADGTGEPQTGASNTTAAGVIDCYARMADGRVHLKRMIFDHAAALAADIRNDPERFQAYALGYLRNLETSLAIPLRLTPAPLRDIQL